MLFIGSAPSRALAADALPIKLVWTASPDCGDAESVERSVRSMLGETPIPAGRPPLEAEVTLRQGPDGRWQVSLRTTTDQARRERSLRAENCEEASRAIALLLALMLDPNARAEPPDQPAAGVPESARPIPQPAPPPISRPPPRPAPPVMPEQRRLGALVGLGGVVDVGTLPEPGYGARLRLGLALDRWSFELLLGAWLPRTARSEQLAGAGGDFSLMEGGLGACHASSRSGHLGVEACAGPMLVHMFGAGFGVTDPGRATALWVALFAEAAVALRATRSVAVRFGVAGLLPLARPTFALAEVGPVHRPQSLVGQAELSLEVLF